MNDVRGSRWRFRPQSRIYRVISQYCLPWIIFGEARGFDIQNRNERRAHQKFCANVD